MTRMKITTLGNDEVEDIPGMRAMPDEGYANYIKQDLFFVDHHEILRSSVGEYPIATSSRQVDLLIEHLKVVRQRMKEAEE